MNNKIIPKGTPYKVGPVPGYVRYGFMAGHHEILLQLDWDVGAESRMRGVVFYFPPPK